MNGQDTTDVDPPINQPQFLHGGLLFPGLSEESDQFWSGQPPTNKTGLINIGSTLV